MRQYALRLDRLRPGFSVQRVCQPQGSSAPPQDIKAAPLFPSAEAPLAPFSGTRGFPLFFACIPIHLTTTQWLSYWLCLRSRPQAPGGRDSAGLTCQCVASPAAGAGPGGVHKCQLSRRACKPMDNEPKHQEPRPGVTVTTEGMDHVSSLSLRTEITAIGKLPCHITLRLNSVTHTCKYIQNVNKEDIKDYFNNFLFN